jgi:hypothetical protein
VVSTEYRLAATDEWVMTRYANREVLDNGGMAFDFGSQGLFDRWHEVARADYLPVVDEAGTEYDLLSIICGATDATMGRTFIATFGEFVGTVELGSGELFARLGLEP